MKLRNGDKIVFTGGDYDEYYTITKGIEYTVHADTDGWMCILDDDGDEAYITNAQGEERSWVERCSYHVVDETNRVMIDAEELLKYISETSAIYGMNVAQVQEYLRGYIKGRKGEIK